MKSSILLVGVAIGAAMVGFVACGGDDSTAASDGGATDDGSLPDSSVGDENNIGPGTDAGDAGRDSAPTDSGPTFVDGSVPAGGNPSTPGVIDCAGKACSSTTATCCSPNPTDAGVFSCVSDQDAGACGATNLVEQECDETADCPTNTICCAVVTNGSFVESACLESCQLRPESRQACKLNGECHNGNACTPQTCSGQQIGLCAPGGDNCH